MPLFRRMQSLIDSINRVMRDQLSGCSGTPSPAGYERIRAGQYGAVECLLAATGTDAASDHADHQRIQRRTDLVRWAARIDSDQMRVGS